MLTSAGVAALILWAWLAPEPPARDILEADVDGQCIYRLAAGEVKTIMKVELGLSLDDECPIPGMGSYTNMRKLP